jgi:phosphoribosylglycinamide formyltransferase-1
MKNSRLQLAGFVSASGSTAAAVAAACREGKLDADMPLVIRNWEGAGEKIEALPHAPTIVTVPRKHYRSDEEFGRVIVEILDQFGIDAAGMWGWDPVMPKSVLDRLPRRIWNQHPALTPDFGGQGMNGIVAVCATRNFAIMVGRDVPVEPVSHWATETLDDGAVIMKGRVQNLPGDTCEILYDRVKLVEHQVQIATVDALIKGTLGEIEVQSPVHVGERRILNRAKSHARSHHEGAKQSVLKRTK